MVILKHYDNGVMLVLHEDRIEFVFPDGSVIRPTEEEGHAICDKLMDAILLIHEGTKQ